MVFYFTGTGNSLFIAKQLDDRIVSIPQIINNRSLVFEAAQIGIVCPIYGHEMPKMVKEFIRKATFKTDYFYIILTYGMLHGGAAELAQAYAHSVGKKVAYAKSIMMVDNFLPNFDMTEQCAIDKKIPESLAAIKADISVRKRQIEKAGLKNRMIHKGYVAMVKGQDETVWAKFRVEDTCTLCGICQKVCPAGAIRLADTKATHTMAGCQACYACVHACPQKAIGFTIPEKNHTARYRNENISLEEIIKANNRN